MHRIILLCILNVIALTCGEVPKCNRKVDLIENYDSSKMKGDWYVVETGNEEKSKKKCMVSTLTDEKGSLDNSVLLKEKGFIEGKPDDLEISLVQVGPTSEYEVQSSEFSPTTVWVVGTDYTSHSIWFLCRNGHDQDGVLMVATREKTPSPELMKKMHDIMENAGFKTDKEHLFSIDHSSC